MMQYDTPVEVAVECLLLGNGSRDHEEWHHCRRVEMHCAMIAKAMDWEPEDIADLKLAALLHHMDRTRIPESVLAPKVAQYLTEFQNRSGFHYGVTPVKTDKPAQAASIIWVADTFDRLVSDQRYRKGLSDTEAIAILRHDAEDPADSAVVEAFLRAYTSKTHAQPKAA